jgi:hypothetical protein
VYPATTLKASVRLVGQSQTIDLTSVGFTPATHSVFPSVGASPTLNGTLTLVTNGSIRGFAVSVNGVTGLTDNGLSLSGVSVAQVSVATINGIGVSLAGTAGTISLSSVNVNGGQNGIVLTNTPATFSVLGSGNNDGSGGIITNTTRNTVHLTNAANVSLRSMRFQNAPTGPDIESYGNGVKVDVSGSSASNVTVTFSQWSGNTARGVYARVTGNGATSFVLTNNNFVSDATVGGLTDVLFDYQGSGTNNFYNVSNNSFTDIPGAALQVQTSSLAVGTQISRGRANNNVVYGPVGGFSNGFNHSLNDGFGSTLVFEAIGNTFHNNGGTAISLNHGPLNGNLHAILRNNNIASTTASYGSGYALIFSPSSAPPVTGRMCVEVTGNNAVDAGGTTRTFRIRQVGGDTGNHPALQAQFQGFTGNTSAQLDAFLRSTNNNFTGAIQYSPAPPTPWNYLNGTCFTVP